MVEDLMSDALLAEYEIRKVTGDCSLVVTETEEEFIKYLDEFDPHIVVSDYQLPSFDGLRALRLVLERKPLTPVIILTGSMNEDTAVECMKAGATDYVIKEHIKRLGTAVLNAFEQRDLRIKQKESLRLLRESEERFRSIFEDNLSVMLLIDTETGEIVDVNKAACKYFGFPRHEFRKRSLEEMSGTDEAGDKIESISSNEHARFETRLKKADGTIRNVEIFSSRIMVSGKMLVHSIVYDITEKKLAEHQVTLLGRVVENSPACIVITDPKGQIEYINPAFTSLTGYSVEEVMGLNCSVLKSGKHSVDFYKDMWTTINKGKNWHGEFLNRKKSGELYWENAIISPLIDSTGKITHFIAVKDDITEKKLLISDLIKAKEKAEENDRLKTSFLHNISHEIRTPLNAIVAFSGFLDQPGLSSGQRREYIDIIFESNRQLLSIINDILSISQIETGQILVNMGGVNIGKVLRNVHLQFKAEAEKKELGFYIFGNDFPADQLIRSDEGKLVHILSNLVSNALKFTSSGQVEIYCGKKDNYVEFRVSDTGIGIAENEQERIFDRFYQIDNAISRTYGGTGLGLSISRAYVELLGGKIKVKSEQGRGSVFTFTIPFSQ